VRLPSIVAALALSGCLGPNYGVPLEELARQVRLPPEARGRHLRVVQQTGGEDPPPARGAHPSGYRGAAVIVVPTPPPRPVGFNPGRVFEGDDAGAAVAVVAVAATVGAFVALGVLSAVEAERYDGWADVRPGHGVYLQSRSGPWYWVPLSALRPEDVPFLRAAFLRDDEGPFERTGRAPLTRPGFAYGLDLGASGVVGFGEDGAPWRPASRIRVGGFPLQWLGLYGTVAFVFASDRGTLLNVRYGAEVQALPLAWGPLHVGLYGEVADNHRLYFPEDRFLERHGVLAGGGPMMELEVTTHLAVTLRGGLGGVETRGAWVPVGSVQVGATVY
jgi:hypothetical protein